MQGIGFSKRLYIGFAAILILMAVCCAFAIIELNDVADQTSNLYEHAFTVSNAVRDIRAETLQMSVTMLELLRAPSQDNIFNSQTQLSVSEERVHKSFDIVFERFLGDKRTVESANNAFLAWKAIREEQIRLLKKGDIKEAESLSDTVAARQISSLDAKIVAMLDFAGNKAKEFQTSAKIRSRRMIVFLLVLAIATIVVGSAIAFLISKSISRPLIGLLPLASDIAAGVVVEPRIVNNNDEIGLLTESFNRIIRSEKAIIDQANAISQGDYSIKITPRSERDQLGFSLARMTTTLREITEKNQHDSWLKMGQAELNDRMRGDQDMAVLCDGIISCLARHLNACVGALFLASDGDILHLTASYAYIRDKSKNLNIIPGEGFVGQAALERKPIVIKEIPKNYLQASSGLGNSTPSSLIVYPLLFHGKIKATIELGFFHEVKAADMEFLDNIAGSIAIVLDSCEARNRMESLLAITQKQAEELQAQQEELRQTNEELQEQQEELRQTNEELQEQSRQIEEQKHAVDGKNRELEEARRLIEEKARDLEVTGKYKSEFLANMSHELRTPLNSILLLSKLLADDASGSLNPRQINFAKTIHDSGAELLELINEILDLSKVEAGKMEVHPDKVILQDFIERLRAAFKPIAEQKNLEFLMDIDEGLPKSIITDRLRLEQIAKNFLSNALKFTEHGSVSLRIQRPLAGTILTRQNLELAHCLAFVVTDTGMGISETKQRLIFEAFQQADGSTSRKYGGTGLGLSISRELTRLLGGEIQLVSHPGAGSSFTLFLPESYQPPATTEPHAPAAAEPESSAPEAPPEPAPSKAADLNIELVPDDRRIITPGDKVLLIVEDDARFAKTLCELAREKDFKALVADNGETGLHFADYYKPSAVILDIGLPGIDGWEVLSRLKENPDTRHIPVHIMSAYDHSVDAIKMGAIGFFTKPISMSMINEAFEKIKTILSRRIKSLLLVENNDVQREAIHEIIGDSDLQISEAASGSEALQLLHENRYDCIVLDLGLPDISGIDLLAQIKDEEDIYSTPVIIYTGKELTPQEKSIISQYAEKLIIKGVFSAEKLLDETALFLHRVEKDLPEAKRRIIRMTHDKETIFTGKKIMIVDDDMRNVYALSSVLEEKGMAVIAARDGVDCLKRLKDHPDANLILMDVMMPELDGYETMRAIREMAHFKLLPIIALTAKAMKGDRDKCVAAGASDYLAKPVDTDKLLSMMRVWLYRNH